ncbi:SpoIIE family protein phosphatase, partial [Actinosynnema sp. NPDC059797]
GTVEAVQQGAGTREELIGTGVTDVVVSGRHAGVPGQGADPTAGRVVTEVWQVRRGDGTVIALELSTQTTPTGTQAIGRDVTERQRAEAERELLLRREHEIAEALQRSLLPGELPSPDRLATAARYLPASTHAQIGGDWYDVLELDATAVALCVGDVVGKGPSAAAVMGQLRTALAGYLLDGHPPAAALERLDLFSRRVNGATGSTCACLTLDTATGALRWSTAGHPPPLVADAGSARFLTGGGGAVLGTPGRPRYVEHAADLPVGSSVMLYTDGLVERHGTPIDEDLARLLAVVGDVGDAAPQALADAVTDALLADGQSDDVALVVARRLPAPLRTTLPARPPSLAAMRREVAAWANAAGLSEDSLDDLQLTLGEAAANVVDHAYGSGTGDLEYELATTPTGVHVVVRDRGRWRPVPADPGHRGRGVQIIRALAERVTFDHREDGTTVEFHLAPATDAPTRPSPVSPTEDSPADQGGGTVRVRLVGELDTATVGELRASTLARVGEAGDRAVEVDLTGVRYLSSSGIALLLDAAAAVRTGGPLTVLVTAGSAPDRVLSLSGLHGLDQAGTLVVRRT